MPYKKFSVKLMLSIDLRSPLHCPCLYSRIIHDKRSWSDYLMFQMHRSGDLMVLRTDLFPLNVPHAFTTRRTSDKKPKPGAPGPADFRIDSLPGTALWWKKLRDSVFSPDHIYYTHTQVHGDLVRLIDFENQPGEERVEDGFKFRVLGEGDGIVRPFTRRKAFIGITTADCLPCLTYDRNSGAVGAIHAGWRGLAADIPAKAVIAFKKSFNSQPKDLLWAIGPSIDKDNYEVGPEVIAALETAGYSDSDWKMMNESNPAWTTGRGDRYMLSLSTCVHIRLKKLGVPENQIDICQLSTFNNKVNFYSYRRDGRIDGLQASVIG